MDKYSTQQKKAKDLNKRTMMTVDDHREMNATRFFTRDEGLARTKESRDEFLLKEKRRHNTKIQARETILMNMQNEHEQKKEMTKLRQMDTLVNLERERKKKQETQDFLLKKEFVRNAFN